MIAIQIARLIANVVLFLDTSDDEILNPDAAVEVMEMLGHDLDALDKGFLRELIDAFTVIAPEYSGEAEKLVRDIPSGFYLEEAVAEGDPEALARLDARHRAEERQAGRTSNETME